MSLVFQNIDPPSSLRPGGGTNSPGGEGGGGSIFCKTRETGLPSYSNNLSTGTVDGRRSLPFRYILFSSFLHPFI
jgi:hypothetical protein